MYVDGIERIAHGIRRARAAHIIVAGDIRVAQDAAGFARRHGGAAGGHIGMLIARHVLIQPAHQPRNGLAPLDFATRAAVVVRAVVGVDVV